MKLVQHSQGGVRRLGVLVDAVVADLALVFEHAVLRPRGHRGEASARLRALLCPSTAADFLALGTDALDRARRVIDYVGTVSDQTELLAAGLLTPLSAVSFEAPVAEVNTVYCVGFNYGAHAAEASQGALVVPDIFLRTAATLAGHRQPILRPAAASTDFDFEAELAVVIGRPGHRIPVETALDHVAGYTCCNDGSLRDYQKRGPSPTPGKNFYRSGSLGPWIITPDEVGDPMGLALGSSINGEVMQSANTREMIFGVREVISFVSNFAYLQPGDVLSTGTPAGVGFRRDPQRWLAPGDELRVTVERVGELTNRVIDEFPNS